MGFSANSSAQAMRTGTRDVTVASLTAEHVSLWMETPSLLPAGLRTFSRAEQSSNEKLAEQTLQRLSRASSPRSATGLLRFVLDALTENLGDGLAEHGRAVLEQMARTGKEFAVRARVFDPTLSEIQLSQALRNLWIMNSIQVMCHLPPSLTPSAFAYSLLYPYTDNILDDPGLTRRKKQGFGLRLGDRLAGRRDHETLAAGETKIRSLISMIEEEWPRVHFAAVYESLLAIHRAQEQGADLRRPLPNASDEGIVRITFAKGGTSVLAHGFLLLGDLSSGACRWIFGYGTFLQMIDDLEDYEEGRSHNQETLFTAARRTAREELIRRLVSYGDAVIAGFPSPSGETEHALHHLIRYGCRLLVMQSVAGQPSMAGAAFARRLEAHSPLRFSSLRSLRQRGRDLQSSKTLNMLALQSRAAASR